MYSRWELRGEVPREQLPHPQAPWLQGPCAATTPIFANIRSITNKTANIR